MPYSKKGLPARKLQAVADEIVARAVLKERERRDSLEKKVLFDRSEKQVPADLRRRILGHCHDKQRELLLDKTRFKLLLCPRRTGKTTYNILEVIIHDLRFPGCMIAYIVPDSRAHAKDLFWLPMQQINEELGLNYIFKEVEKRVITPQGTNILILGAHDADSPKRLRGNPYGLVLLDQIYSFWSKEI